MSSQSDRWNRLAFIHDRDREVACRAYLDLIARRKTKNVESALKLKLGSAMLIEVPYVLELIGNVQGKKILDAGCGGGFYSLLLWKNGAKVIGIDSSEQMIRIANEKASRKRIDVKFRIGDVTDLRLENEMFDLALSTLVLMDVDKYDKAVSELVRVTRTGGDIVISAQHPTFTAGDWERESGQKLFRQLDDYFMERELETVWENERKERVPFKYYHRSLQAYVQPFLERKCVLKNLIEPYPHESYKLMNSREYEDTKRIPHFIIFKFQKIAR